MRGILFAIIAFAVFSTHELPGAPRRF